MALRVFVDIELRGDFSAAAAADDLADAVDYRLPCVEAARLAADGEYLLIETLADRIAGGGLGARMSASRGSYCFGF